MSAKLVVEHSSLVWRVDACRQMLMATWKSIELTAKMCSCGSVCKTGGFVSEAINNSLLPNFRAQLIALLI